jgi:hypothetical protein
MSDCILEDDLRWEPEDYLQQVMEREATCTEVMELIQDKARLDSSKNWAHHLPQILNAVDFFRELCRDEIEHYGEWRYHGFQIDEVIDFIDEDLDELTKWICRMTNTPPPDADEDVDRQEPSNE